MLSAYFPIWTAQALPSSGVVQSGPYGVKNMFGYAVQVIWTGTPTGTLTLQGSNDLGVVVPDGTVTGVSHWTTITSTSVPTNGAAGNTLYNISDVMYRWFQVVYTASSGTGTAIANAEIKGA